MTETEAVAGDLGIELPISIDQRIAGAEQVGGHKMSMLQDFEAGRPMELEAVGGAAAQAEAGALRRAGGRARSRLLGVPEQGRRVRTSRAASRNEADPPHEGRAGGGVIV